MSAHDVPSLLQLPKRKDVLFLQARERKHLLEFLEDYDDYKDDPKYYK